MHENWSGSTGEQLSLPHCDLGMIGPNSRSAGAYCDFFFRDLRSFGFGLLLRGGLSVGTNPPWNQGTAVWGPRG